MTGAGGFRGNPQEFTDTAKAFDAAQGEMGALLSKLRSDVALALEGWQSPAAKQFGELMARLDQKAKTQSQKLAEIGHLINQAGISYGASDEEQSSAVNRVANSAGSLDSRINP
jgi:WXG100 family type VII secretion target